MGGRPPERPLVVCDSRITGSLRGERAGFLDKPSRRAGHAALKPQKSQVSSRSSRRRKERPDKPGLLRPAEIRFKILEERRESAVGPSLRVRGGSNRLPLETKLTPVYEARLKLIENIVLSPLSCCWLAHGKALCLSVNLCSGVHYSNRVVSQA